MKYDMLSLGPARMDVFVKLPEEQVEEVCSIDRKRCMIELGFGEKIPVSGVYFAVGGNTGNNAVGLTRLGMKVAMAGTMGDGWTDKQAREILKTEGVETKYICEAKDQMGLGVVINYAEERTILSYYPKAECSFPQEEDLDAAWIYLTTAGEDFAQFYADAVDWAKKHGAKIGFNPGSRQIRQGAEKLKVVFSNTEVLFVNREEAAYLQNKPVDLGIKDSLNGLLAMGPKVVIITDGPDGTYSFDGKNYLHMPIVEAPVVERTGAGDAFGSGFLAAYMKGKTIEEALRWGTVNSASVLGYVGPQAGLLNEEKLNEWLDKSGNVKLETL